MPYLNKPPKKEKNTNHNNTDMRELRRKAYNNSSWRKTRDTYMKEHPICEECLKYGKVTPAEDIHHIKSPFKNGEINYTLLLDYTNLMALCKTCHAEIHNRQEGKQTVQDVLRTLADLLDIKEDER